MSELSSFQERGITVVKDRASVALAKKSLAVNRETIIGHEIGIINNAEPETFIPQTVAEFFFADDEGELPRHLDLQEVDLLYNDYIRVMTCMHERLRAVFNTYVLRFLDEKLRKQHGLEADTARMVLPGEDSIDDFTKMFEDVTTMISQADEKETLEPRPSNCQGEEEKKNEELSQAEGECAGRGAPDLNNESQCNVREDDAFESFSERKASTNVPTLIKNNKNP